MNEKQVIPVINRIDDIVDGYKKKCFDGKVIPLQLIQFLDHSRKTNNSIDKRVNKFNEYYVVENWTAINLFTQEIGKYAVPHILGHKYDEIELTQESSLTDRPEGQYPNNEEEVNLLQDSYDEYLNNERDGLLPDFHLSIVVAKHKLRMAHLRKLIDSEVNLRLKSGYVLHYIQRETPTILGKRKYEEWCNNNPQLFTKLKENVYQTNDLILS